MTNRDQFYIEQAKLYAQKDNINDKEALAFSAGMKMADTYQNWIPVSERLPEKKKGPFSEDVMIYFKAWDYYCGDWEGFRLCSYNHEEQEWFTDYGRMPATWNVTHWRELIPPGTPPNMSDKGVKNER